MNPEDVPFPEGQVGMWTVSSLPDGKVRVLHWNGEMIVKMESPWYDSVKFAAAMIVHSQEVLAREGKTPEEAKSIVLDRLFGEMNLIIERFWENYERYKRLNP